MSLTFLSWTSQAAGLLTRRCARTSGMRLPGFSKPAATWGLCQRFSKRPVTSATAIVGERRNSFHWID